MKARYSHTTLSPASKAMILQWIKAEGGYTDGKAMNEAFATMHGVTARDASKRGAYGAYIARRVNSKALTVEEATEYMYEFYYLPYRTQFDNLLKRSPTLAYLLFTSLGMGVGLRGPGAPIDDWFGVVAAALRLNNSGATHVMQKVNALFDAGVDVDERVRAWLKEYESSFLDDVRRSAAIQRKPVGDGWVNRFKKMIDVFMAGSSAAGRRYSAPATTTVSPRNSMQNGDLESNIARVREVLARTRGFIFGK